MSEAGQLRSERFRDQRQWDWRELDRLVTKAERRQVTALTDDELLALPILYRSALSALSTARATSLDKALIEYLESLCTRAYFFIYGVRGRPYERMVDFLAFALPAAVKRLWRETLVCAGVTILGTVIAFMLVRAEPDWFYSLIGGEAQGRDPSASAEFLRKVLYDGKGKDGLAAFAAMLMTHNSQVALMAFALGFAFGAPTLILLFINGCALGALLEVYAAKGLTWDLVGWLSIHGVTELTAINLAGAAGLHIGVNMAFPGRRDRADALVEAGRTGGVVMAGVVMMLVCAGLLEGIGRQQIVSLPIRFAVAGATLVFWYGYFYLPRRERKSG